MISLSLRLSPHELTIIISRVLIEQFELSWKAWEGSRDGEIFSNLETN